MYQFPDDVRVSRGIWEKVAQTAVKGAAYDSRERQPHPKCWTDTRVVLLNRIYGLLDDREKSRLIWLHGTAGVGKSAVAFTVAERMRGLKVTEQIQTNIEKRLAGTFFFSRKHTKRCTTGYFFATFIYQLAINFPSIRGDVIKAIHEDPALLDPDRSLQDQMEALFLRPLRRLRLRLLDCAPLAFIVDALDECMSKTEAADLISALSQALHAPDLPVVHILLTSRSEAHIREAMQEEEARLPIIEIPANMPAEGVVTTISLDAIDVDDDIFFFLLHSLKKLQNRHNFPLPTEGELERLASRAGRRFIVASTMMKFIDDGYNDPRDRLQLMLELTSTLLPGTEVYKLYDCILSTCADPQRAYMHLSVVAALADPLPVSQISELLGPGQGRDVEITLSQLRCVMEVPTDSSLPVNIHHSSLRDYVSNPSNCSLPQVQYLTHPHHLLAHSSLRLMMHDIPESTALLDALLELKKHTQAGEPHNQCLKDFLTFIVEPPDPLQVLMGLLWLRGDRRPGMTSWLETLDGRAWSRTQGGRCWLATQDKSWALGYLLRVPPSPGQLKILLQDQGGPGTKPVPVPLPLERWSRQGEWLETLGERECETWSGPGVETRSGPAWVQTPDGQEWLSTMHGRYWLETQSGEKWLGTQSGEQWLVSQSGHEWLLTKSGREWLQTQSGEQWLGTQSGEQWLESQSGHEWLLTKSGRGWLETQSGRDWLQMPNGQAWQSTLAASVWVTLVEVSSTLEAINEYTIVSNSPLPPAFQVIQQCKSLPDFLTFPVVLALRPQHHSSDSKPAIPQGRRFPPDMRIFDAMQAFVSFANEAQDRSRQTSEALKYACQHWAFHLSRTKKSCNNLHYIFKSFWDHLLLSWLERQWCLNGLQSCLVILSEGEKLAKDLLHAPDSSQTSV
ncbi:hypothetical protein DEU56DRAFT_170275 [Suillus clintonianus]|uniref:uncharacterized protein n=1 Tax=Suillus clintonianus TaxID=1904413 RepID=UPI001B8865D6|nr:uncharacterized protein DEU56DRAFT_170275 [Suillus clintonianus]KAG2146299.1 hypothetical protein DEU56DRAFT_170275 [Suillus clintonianus]